MNSNNDKIRNSCVQKLNTLIEDNLYLEILKKVSLIL